MYANQKGKNFTELVCKVPSIKIENKKNLSGVFAEVSESFGIFEIAWVVSEIFGFEILKFSGLITKK